MICRKFFSLKAVIGSRLLQVVLTGENSSCLGITETCKVAAELLHATAPWPLWMLLVFTMIAARRAATRSPTHMYLCLKQPLWLTYRVAFWNFTDREAVKVLNELKDEVRTEFHFALRPPFHCCDLCMPGVQAIQTGAPFHFFFYPTF